MKHTDTLNNSSSKQPASVVGATVMDVLGNEAHIQSLRQEGDNTFATLVLDDGTIFSTDFSLLEREKDHFLLPVSFKNSLDNNRDNRQSDWTETVNIPVIQEEISIGTRQIDTGKGVRVRKHVTAHEEIVDVSRSEEILSVQHIEVGKIVSEDELPQPRQEGNTYIIPVFEEVYVIEKKIRLKEEVRITKERKESTETQQINLNSERVEIERFNEADPRE